MKLKYYLRGMGIGVILTAIIMGFALGGRTKPISDAEIIERAKNLGMVEGGVLTDFSTGNSEEVASANISVTEVSKENKKLETKAPAGKKEDKVTEGASSSASTASSKAVTSPQKENKKDETKKEEPKKEEVKKEEVKKEEPKKEEPKKEEAKKEEPKKEEPKKEENKNDEVKEESPAPSENAQVTDQTVSENEVPVTVRIPGGMSSDSVAELLHNEGIVDNATSFNKYLIERGVDRKIRSGTKTFPANATYEQIADVIVK